MELNASILMWSLERGRFKAIVAEATDPASGETAFAASARDICGQLHIVSARSELGALLELAEQLRFDGLDSMLAPRPRARAGKGRRRAETAEGTPPSFQCIEIQAPSPQFRPHDGRTA